MKFVGNVNNSNTTNDDNDKEMEKHEIDSKTVEKLKNLTLDGSNTIEIQPNIVRKTPKFPSRERHKAIRRKSKPTSPPFGSTTKNFSFMNGDV